LFCGSAVLSKNASPEEIERVYASVREYKMSLKEREGLQKAEERKKHMISFVMSVEYQFFCNVTQTCPPSDLFVIESQSHNSFNV
jgi:hypothetical protein